MGMIQHEDVTSIHIFAYVTSTDPGAVGAKKGWVDTTTGPPYVLKVRNNTNTGWNTVGVTGFTGLHVLSDDAVVDVSDVTTLHFPDLATVSDLGGGEVLISADYAGAAVDYVTAHNGGPTAH